MFPVAVGSDIFKTFDKDWNFKEIISSTRYLQSESYADQ
jgi:hypothetical protein